MPLEAIFRHSLRAMMQTRTCDSVTVNLSVLANWKHGETCGLISSITQPPSLLWPHPHHFSPRWSHGTVRGLILPQVFGAASYAVTKLSPAPSHFYLRLFVFRLRLGGRMSAEKSRLQTALYHRIQRCPSV